MRAESRDNRGILNPKNQKLSHMHSHTGRRSMAMAESRVPEERGESVEVCLACTWGELEHCNGARALCPFPH